ncbi:hypothetical protein tpqmel_0866 [Candidatus Gastranaerophilus sp. (ex Termes propinquus)]|nr:hypothetical protein tpqmel_0866 [Candidatus Gastranaerophilus sp. (ex Termes propinquus)]
MCCVLEVFIISPCTNAINFKGVAPRETRKDGVILIPLHSKPSGQSIEAAIKATESSKNRISSGLNGTAFVLGQDLVVKKYKGEKAINNDPMREVNILDDMYEKKFSSPKSQKGQYAMQMPDGTFYLVSTKVDGKNPDPVRNTFNKQNLASLLSEITRLDQGVVDASGGRSRFMNWDFNSGNINITKDKAGLFDFEYGTFENLDKMLEKNVVNNCEGACPHLSDTSRLYSSLRSFEVWALVDYLNKVEHPDKLFGDYLELKGKYHADMAEFYGEYENESKYPDAVKNIAESEKVHSRLLRRDEGGEIPQDIQKAEMKKMQAANFINIQSQFSSDGKVCAQVKDGKILTSQVKEYIDEALFFSWNEYSKSKKTGDSDREVYYSNCLDYFFKQSLVKDWMQYQLDKPQGPGILKDKIASEPRVTLDDTMAKALRSRIKTAAPTNTP